MQTLGLAKRARFRSGSTRAYKETLLLEHRALTTSRIMNVTCVEQENSILWHYDIAEPMKSSQSLQLFLSLHDDGEIFGAVSVLGVGRLGRSRITGLHSQIIKGK